MRVSILTQTLSASLCLGSVSALSFVPSFLRPQRGAVSSHGSSQRPLVDMDLSALSNIPGLQKSSNPSGSVILSDVLGKDRSINVFAGFTRDISGISSRLDNSGENTTVLAPLNSAITSLPRKPWEDPKDYEVMGASAYDGSAGQDRAQENLRRFVEAHIVPTSPWKEGERVKTVGGGEIWYTVEDGVKKIQPGDIEVSSVAENVANGQVWVLKATLNYR